MEFPFASLDEVTAEIRRVAFEIISRDKFPVFLGGEHSITGPIVAAMAQKHSGLSVLQIDAHADLRDTYMGTPHNHACAMRRALEYARATQVGIRSMSPEEAAAAPTLPTEIFYDYNMRNEENWIERVVDSLGETVYITVDVDGLDPAIMPATGTPEPGGLLVVRDAGAAAAGDRDAERGGMRRRGTGAHARNGRAEFPVREADLQNPQLQVRRATLQVNC